MVTVSKLFGSTALTAAVFAGVVPVVAQNQGGEASFSLEEITVTAQKRAESIQDVAIAISAFNGNDLDKINAVDVTDVVSRTPNFNMTQFNLGEPQFTIRGVGSTSDSAASDPTVPVFVDEVYNARPGSGAFDFFDLERVEVLRGPQGTLYGRNTSGGAVNIITKKPSQEAYSKVFLSYGNYDSMQAKAVFNGGLTETVAAKLSLAYRKHDGYSENILTGDELMDAENFSARLQFMFEPSDTTSLLISTDYSKDDNGGNARVPLPSLAPLDAFIKLQFPDGTSIRKSYANPDSFQKRDMGGIMAKYEQEMDWATLTSISAYRETDYSWFEDLGGLEFGNPEKPWVLKNDDHADEKASQFSQELRLSSKPEEMVKWVAGLYYFTESVDRTERFVTAADIIFPPVLGGDVSFLQDVKTHSYAAFAETTYPISENFQITGGLRYTHDKKSVNQVTTDNDGSDPVPGLPLLAAPFDVSARDSWDALTGKISLEYKSDNVLYYGTVSRGYKSGMFPSQPNDPVVAVTAQPPERLWNYEIGIKSDLMDKRVRLNVAAFLMDYSNLQLFQLTPELRLQTFSGTAKNYGAEVELAAAVTPELEIGANGSYLHTNLKETSIGMFAGSDLSVSPTWSYNLYVDWSRQLDGGEISVRADYQWRDEYNRGFTPEGGQPPAESNIPSLGLLDARIAYAFKENQYEVALWGKNLTNKDYQTHVIPFVGSGFSLFGPPRTYGVSFTAHF